MMLTDWMHIDGWQLSGSLAALAFTIGFIDQIRMTHKTQDVTGLSVLQWMVFATASMIFAAYYVHLEQWMMVAVSVFGTLCCLLMLIMIFKYRRVMVDGDGLGRH